MATSQPLNDLNQSDQENGPTEIFTEKAGMRPKCFSSTLQECLFVLTATMAIGQQSFFQGCIVGVTASIGSDLNMNSAEITWINAGASYVTSYISSILITSYTTSIIHYFSWFSKCFNSTNRLIDSAAVHFYLHSANWQTCSAGNPSS